MKRFFGLWVVILVALLTIVSVAKLVQGIVKLFLTWPAAVQFGFIAVVGSAILAAIIAAIELDS